MRAVSDLRSILSGGRGSLPAAAHARGVDSLGPRARWPGPSELGASACNSLMSGILILLPCAIRLLNYVRTLR